MDGGLLAPDVIHWDDSRTTHGPRQDLLHVPHRVYPYECLDTRGFSVLARPRPKFKLRTVDTYPTHLHLFSVSLLGVKT